jgi:hypothetical protein
LFSATRARIDPPKPQVRITQGRRVEKLADVVAHSILSVLSVPERNSMIADIETIVEKIGLNLRVKVDSMTYNMHECYRP